MHFSLWRTEIKKLTTSKYESSYIKQIEVEATTRQLLLAHRLKHIRIKLL